MRSADRLLAVVLLMGVATPSVGQTIFDGPSVESAELRVELRPRGEDRFAIYLTDKVTGQQVDYEFDGEGANDPEPFLMVEGRYCNTSVILLTIEFPWRHSLQQYTRVLDTYAFRTSDLAYIDMTAGPVTDIALLDSSEIETEDMSMQPPILVECISDRAGIPFRFDVKTID
ncbi:hypothetical protein [Paracoccus alkenifer]|uniref:Uncharacterized protein n=1 Tax=Paracoccus alkenifer TaxID=65735 RepID=A0A1H6JAF8_9RHOB|nr:hypothetical protein [Paracoccus alkenifer]SEH59236.1 hypothetical protein SAMN04488075_0246 [Paracoccus alkenifer]